MSLDTDQPRREMQPGAAGPHGKEVVRSGMPGTLRSSEGGSGTWFAAIAGRDGVPRDQMVTIT